MKNITLFVFCVIFGFFTLSIVGQVLNPTKKYCYNFTWLGPRYTNDSGLLNITCDDATQLASNIPCRQPLVITEDGTYPDIQFMWENYAEHITCSWIESEVCASYTYRFNGIVENVTFLCTKVVVTDDEQSITRGCLISKQGSRETELCICEPTHPGQPCNSAGRNPINLAMMFALLLLIYFYVNK